MLMIDTRMEPAIAKNMVQGAPDTLHSEFHLSYAMLLNLLLSEAADPESLLRASFRQFQVERSLPALTQRIAQMEVSDTCHPERTAPEECWTPSLPVLLDASHAPALSKSLVSACLVCGTLAMGHGSGSLLSELMTRAYLGPVKEVCGRVNGATDLQ